MPFQLLDLILVGIMLVSGLLALMRGFTREVLSLIAWGVAAIAALGAVLSPELNALVSQYLQPDIVAKIALGGGVFLVVLIVMSLISVRIADWVLDSAAGAVDRTMGFVYGLGRGLLLVVVAYLFYIWLVPKEKHEDWIRNAQLLPVIENVGGVVISFLPADIAEVLKGKTYISGQPANPPAATQPGSQPDQEEENYQPGQQRNLNQLIESTQGGQGGQSTQGSQSAPPAGGETEEPPDSVPDAPAETDAQQPVFGGQSTTGQ